MKSFQSLMLEVGSISEEEKLYNFMLDFSCRFRTNLGGRK